jgi:hypothetical protein
MVRSLRFPPVENLARLGRKPSLQLPLLQFPQRLLLALWNWIPGSILYREAIRIPVALLGRLKHILWTELTLP